MKKVLCVLMVFAMLAISACGSKSDNKTINENNDISSNSEYLIGTVYSIEDNSLENPTKTTIIIKSDDTYYSLYSNYEGKTLNFSEGQNRFTIGNQVIIEYTGELKENTDTNSLGIEEGTLLYDLEFEHIVEVSVLE